MADSGLVAVDVGTTLVKAVRYGADGAEATVARRPVAVSRPQPGWAEQDMDDVWDAVVAAVREAVGSAPVSGLTVTAQGDGAWLVDHRGRPTGPALLWNDGRAGDVVEQWRRDGVLVGAAAHNPSRLTSGMSTPLLTWLARHDPERLDRSAQVLSCGGWVLHRLTGELWVEQSDASAPLLDLATGDWSEPLLALYDEQARRRLLPTVVPSGTVAGLSADAAAALGLPAGLPVVVAPYDVCTTAIGAGALAPGAAACVLGTTLATEVVVDVLAPPASDEGVGITLVLGAPGRWLRCYPTMAGGDVLAWGADLLGVADAPALVELAATGRVDTAGVRFLPYLAPAGERVPFVDAGARGSLTGLSFDAGRGDVARALVDGLSLTVSECLDLAAADTDPPKHLTLCGGGAASDFWTATLADACGLPVTRCRDREVGARGAMLVASVSLGEAPDLESAAATHVRLSEPVLPTVGSEAAWRARLEEHRHLRAALAPTWPGRGTA